MDITDSQAQKLVNQLNGKEVEAALETIKQELIEIIDNNVPLKDNSIVIHIAGRDYGNVVFVIGNFIRFDFALVPIENGNIIVRTSQSRYFVKKDWLNDLADCIYKISKPLYISRLSDMINRKKYTVKLR